MKLLKRRRVHYLLARSRPRRQKERAIRRRQRRGLARGLKKLQKRIEDGRLKNRDKILESVGRLKGRFPKARPFVTITVAKSEPATVELDLGSGRNSGRPWPATVPTCCGAIKTAGRPRSSGRPTSS